MERRGSEPTAALYSSNAFNRQSRKSKKGPLVLQKNKILRHPAVSPQNSCCDECAARGGVYVCMHGFKRDSSMPVSDSEGVYAEIKDIDMDVSLSDTIMRRKENGAGRPQSDTTCAIGAAGTTTGGDDSVHQTGSCPDDTYLTPTNPALVAQIRASMMLPLPPQLPKETSPSRHSPLHLQRISKIRTVKDMPDDVTKLTHVDILKCLELLNLSDYRGKFIKDQIDGELLVGLSVEELQQSFDMTPIHAKKLHNFACNLWRPDIL